jgi:uncharacterized protein (UPF0335 family)
MNADIERAAPHEKNCAEESPSNSQVDRSKLREFFETFQKLESDAKSLNREKAELFASAKNSGFDRKAMQAAFRHHLRGLEKPDKTAAHDKLTESYLIALRPEHRRGSDSAASQKSQIAAPGDGSRNPRTHARPRTREGVDTPDAAPDRSSISKNAESSSPIGRKSPALDEEEDVPDFLKAKKESKQQVSAHDGVN